MTIELLIKNEISPIPFTEKKIEGLKLRQSPQKVTFILAIEKVWEVYALNRTEKNLNRLINAVEFSLQRKAESWGYKWENKRLSKDDFLSVFYETVWKLADSYTHYQNFYFYETLCLAIDRAGIDLTRKLLTKQVIFEVSTVSFFDEAPDYLPDKSIDIEKDLEMKELIHCILSAESLAKEERQLLQVIYDNPDASYRQIAELTGLKHHENVVRALRKIFKKINLFIS